jgi:DMSO/TMAO reductase YedYZ molybdopterin-dependent catalytic subunit
VAQSPLLASAPELSSSPEIRPTPLDALGLTDMPTDLHFVRNHFDVPDVDATTWCVEVGGAVETPTRLTLDDLRAFPAKTQAVTLECAGHRREEFEPTAQGVQWGVGAVAEARWTGVPLEEILLAARPSERACEVVFEGADCGTHRTTDDQVAFARSIPLGRALTGDVLLAWAMNGRPIPPKHGAPLRVIVPGVYAVASVKWLRRIEVLEEPFEGPFQAEDYRMLGLSGNGNGESLHELGINALIVSPQVGDVLDATAISISGVAWGGRGTVASVEVRIDGEPWRPAAVTTPNPPYGLAHWHTVVVGIDPGEHTLEVRAHDKDGFTQPALPRWNALGYANNSRHRVTITVAP